MFITVMAIMPFGEFMPCFFNCHPLTLPRNSPEVIESNFYAWRATGDKKYYDNAVRFIDSLRDATSVGDANAGIGDVRQAGWGESGFFDDTERYVRSTKKEQHG